MSSSPLPAAPTLLDDGHGAPRFGTYAGSLERLDFGPLHAVRHLNPAQRLARHKRWFYGFVATREVAALFAIVDVGYAANGFFLALDYATGRVLADDGWLGVPGPLVGVNEHVNEGLSAHFVRPDVTLSASRGLTDDRFALRARVGVPLAGRGARLDAQLFASGAAPPLTVIAPVDGGVVNVTQKWAGLETAGELRAGGRRYSLEGGVGGVDSTLGYLARRTAWRWAFVCGRLRDGTPLGLNLVEGFNESRDDVNENALWLGRRLLPLGRARFKWNHDDPLDRWHVTTTDGVVDLTFKPFAVHRETRDLVLVRSRFLQPVGLWSGTLLVDGQRLAVEDAPGVSEDQDVVW